MSDARGPHFGQMLVAPVTVRRALKVAAIVGTLLVLLNHGDGIVLGVWPDWWKVVLTYLVPYSVSSYSTAAFIRDLARDPQHSPLVEPIG